VGPHLGAKEALLTDPDTYLMTPHVDGGELEELVTEAWPARAPRQAARVWLDDAPPVR
jgi:hypothetical protein